MFGVLIVDDEMIIRYGIKSMIDWEKLGMVVVGDASNGKEALEIFLNHQPEIVITDIKMPLMDGIELIRQIRKINEKTKIILLSCLQDFEYAREAIRMEVSEYLLKSDMMPSDLERVLKKVSESIIIDHDNMKKILDFRQKAQMNQSLEKERFLIDASTGVLSQKEVTKEVIENLGLDYLQSGFYVIRAEIDYYEKLISDLSEKNRREINALLKETGENILGDTKTIRGEIFSGNYGEISFVVNSPVGISEKLAYDEIHKFGESLVTSVQNKLNYSISVGISDTFNEIFRIKDAFFQAHEACKFKTFFGCGRVTHFVETLCPQKPKKKINLDIKLLQDYVYCVKREKVNSLLDDIFNGISGNKDLDGVNFVSLELVLILSSIHTYITENEDEVISNKREYYKQIKHLETVSDFKDWFKNSFSRLIDIVESKYHDDKDVIAKALNYIKSNYMKNISLQMISDHVHLSKNYFVNLFKRQVGESFVEHLTRIRIEKAKELLKDQKMKAADVGNMVGFYDPRYFSKVFKKMTGLTPTEYKEMSI